MISVLIGAIDVSFKVGSIQFSLIDILLHLFNFLILAVGMTFLIYKPVRKFIDERRDNIQKEIQKGEKLQESAKAKLEEYHEKLADAEKEATEIKENTLNALDIERQRILDEANAEAMRIVDSAKKEGEDIRKQTVEDVKNEVTDAVIDIATKVIGREVSKEDNQRIIDDCLKKWSENGEQS